MADRPLDPQTGYEYPYEELHRQVDVVKLEAPSSRRSVSPQNKFNKALHGCSGSTEPNRSKRGIAQKTASLRKPRSLGRSSSSPLTDKPRSTSPELIEECDVDVKMRNPPAVSFSLPAVSQTPIMYVDADAARAALFPHPVKSPAPSRPGSTGPYGPVNAPSSSNRKTRPRAGSRSPPPARKVLTYDESDEISPLIRLRTPLSISTLPQDDCIYTQADLEQNSAQWREAGAAAIQHTRDRAYDAMQRTGEVMDQKAAREIASAIAETQDDLAQQYQAELYHREQHIAEEAQKYVHLLDTKAQRFATRVELDADRKVESVRQEAEFLHSRSTEQITHEAWSEIKAARAESARMQLKMIQMQKDQAAASEQAILARQRDAEATHDRIAGIAAELERKAQLAIDKMRE
jgi:hypothetical protein